MEDNATDALSALNAHLKPGEAQRVVCQVARRLEKAFWWMDVEDIEQEAVHICLTKDVLTKATSAGAFHVFLFGALLDWQATEREWQTSRIVGAELADVSLDGTVFLRGGEGDEFEYASSATDLAAGFRGTADPAIEEARDGYEVPENRGRSYLLDRLSNRDKAEFLEWAKAELGGAWGKKRDVETLLYGHEDEILAIWMKYAKGKHGDNYLHVTMPASGPDLPPLDKDEKVEAMQEGWIAPSRYPADRRAADLMGERPLRDRKQQWTEQA